MRLTRLTLLKFLLLTTLAANSNYAHAQNRADLKNSTQCRENLDRLRKDLIRILRKTPAMPPLAKLYGPLRRILNEEENNYRAGYYVQCIYNTERALRISSMYR